jgi:hypothetical protein
MSRRRYLRGSELAAGKIALRDLETIHWRRALRHLRLHLAAGDQLEHEGEPPADLMFENCQKPGVIRNQLPPGAKAAKVPEFPTN